MTTRFSGYYKYKSGDVFTNRQKKVVEGKKDYGTIYAVFYDNHDEEGNSVVLYGDNVQTQFSIYQISRRIRSSICQSSLVSPRNPVT